MCKEDRILIFSGGNLGEWALKEIRDNDYLIGVDSGAWFLVQNNLKPHFAIGDFDSVTEEEYRQIRRECGEIYSCDPVDKDYTDTEMAFNWAMVRNPKEIVLLGAAGSRLDHTLANLHLLYKGLKKGILSRVLDEKNEIIITDKNISISKNSFRYISLLPFSFEVTGVTLEGFKYPLNNAAIKVGESIGISNVLLDDVGKINIKSGILLVIRSSD